MADLKLSTTALSDVKDGTTQIDKVYAGTNLIWQNKVLVTNKTASTTLGTSSFGNYSMTGGWTTSSNVGSGNYLQQGNNSWNNGASGVAFFDWNSYKSWFDGYANNSDIENCRVTKINIRWNRYDWGSTYNRQANIFFCDRTSRSGTPKYYGPQYTSGFTHPASTNSTTYDNYGYNTTAEDGIGEETTTATNSTLMSHWQNGTVKSVAFYSSFNVSGNNYLTYLFLYAYSTYLDITITYDQWEKP